MPEEANTTTTTTAAPPAAGAAGAAADGAPPPPPAAEEEEDAWTKLHRQMAERLAPAGVGVDEYLAYSAGYSSNNSIVFNDDSRVPLPPGTIDATQFLDTLRDLEAKLVPGALADDGRGRFHLITDRERAMYQERLHQIIVSTPDTHVFILAESFRAAMGPMLRARMALRLARLRDRAQKAAGAPPFA